MSSFKRMVAVVWLCGFSAAAQLCAQQAQLTNYRAGVSFSSERLVAVQARFDVHPGKTGGSLELSVVRYPGQTIEAATITAQGTSKATFEELAGALIAHVPWSDSYTVSYTVRSDARLERVPLPVPNALPVSRDRPINLEVSVPAGEVIVGDTFPTLTSRNATGGSARLVAAPSVLQLRISPEHAISLGDRIFGPAQLTTVLMVLVLGSGSLVWYRNSRRA